eukprot:Filipodium_phascolosomae@DN2632_c0_g1_i1.p1
MVYGFPVKAGATVASAQTIGLAFVIATVGSTGAPLTVTLPVGYAIANEDDCKLTAAHVGSNNDLVVTTCTGKGRTANLIIGAAPVDSEKYEFRLKVLTPTAPSPTENDFKVDYSLATTMTKSADEQLAIVGGSTHGQANGGDDTDAVLRPNSMLKSTDLPATFHFTLTRTVAEDGFLVVSAPTGFTVATGVCDAAEVKSCNANTCTAESLTNDWDCTKSGGKGIQLKRKNTAASGKVFQVKFTVSTPSTTGSAGKGTITTCVSTAASCPAVARSGYLGSDFYMDFGETKADVSITSSTAGTVISDFEIASGKSVKPTAKDHVLDLSFQLSSGALSADDKFTVTLPKGFTFSANDCKHDLSSGKQLVIKNCVATGGNVGEFTLSAPEGALNTALHFGTKVNVVKMPEGTTLNVKLGKTTLSAEMEVKAVKGSSKAKTNAGGDENEAVMLPLNITQNFLTELSFVFELTTAITKVDESLLVKLPQNFTIAEQACDNVAVATKLENCGSSKCEAQKVGTAAGNDVHWVCKRLGTTAMRLSRSGSTVDALKTVRVSFKATSPPKKQVPAGSATIYTCTDKKKDCTVPTMAEYLSDDYNDFGETKNINRSGARPAGILASIALVLLAYLI